MGKVVGIWFQRGGKIYDFDAGHFVLERGESVIVDTEYGLALGEVVRPPVVRDEAEYDPEHPLKKVFRLATSEDMQEVEKNQVLEKDAFNLCLERIAARELEMNLVKVECLFDRSKMIFYFTADGRLDFRELVRDLVSRLRVRVEMRQIGVRHEAKLLGGLGSCGRELCCCTFLGDFEPVSVKMAKEQNLSLNPTKISGLCGRLMCCLTYEYETYRELKRRLPKPGKRLTLSDGREFKVMRQNVLESKVTVLDHEGQELILGAEEIAELTSPPQSQAAEEAGGGETGGRRKRRRSKKKGPPAS
jgi:cell fate regulator YaaT (PSP1 superfamily)